MPEERSLMIMRKLPVPLDTYRKMALGNEQAEARREEMRIADHMKNVTDSLKQQIKDAQRKQTMAAEAICNGFEHKDVACRQEVDLHTNTMKLIREDTGTVVEERALEPKERQRLVNVNRKP